MTLKTLQLKLFAETIRRETLQAFVTAGAGHIGGSMSIVETLAVLYGRIMNITPNNPQDPNRDRFVMSKGHAGPSLYAALALKGYFPLDWLGTLNKNGTSLPSHCDMKKTPGIDVSTGSLGQGLSIAIGLALGQRFDNNACTYAMLGDGELNEGQIWEAAQFAPFHKLNNLIAFVDNNGKQLDGTTDDVLAQLDIGAKFAAFGWHTQVIDGHDIDAIITAITNAKAQDTASMIVLNTIKGNGCQYVAETAKNHHMPADERMQPELVRIQRDIDALTAQLAELGGQPLC
ncbi:MAG: transketolase [Oscillospiraceae bacterium]|nr:transketolase [Oscillospiraceae bacterium]